MDVRSNVPGASFPEESTKLLSLCSIDWLGPIRVLNLIFACAVSCQLQEPFMTNIPKY